MDKVKEVFEKDLRVNRPYWQKAYEIADKGLEKYRKTWSKEFRGCRENLADVISIELMLIRNKAYEEAAKIAESMTDGVHPVYCENIAKAIRALKEGKT